MCKGPCASGSPGDAPDPDLLGMLGADGLGRLKRLQERLIQPQGILGPCPPPSFPGHEEFFRDFLQTASWSDYRRNSPNHLTVLTGCMEDGLMTDWLYGGCSDDRLAVWRML